jgi:hypothetical protein
MGGGGKGGTSTSTVSIPPEVLARYNAVNARAEEVAKKPFEAYTGEFVAPITEEQQQGISQTQKYSEAAQPYYARAAGMTEDAYNASQPLTSEQIQQYQNPYIQSVVDPTLKALQQQQGIDRQTQAAQAIRSGAFGGERAGLQRAVLGGQQELAQAQAISPLYADAYKNALATAAQQQAQRVSTGLAAGQQTAGIGTTAQKSGLEGGQAVIGAGTLKQQTTQALDTAKYQQFLQERGYDFQTAQFLANIAMGTGALTGSTTTTTQPTSFFSDERLKHDIKQIGKTNDGQPIYSFKYKGDNRTQIGLLAQEVEKKHPEAVGLSGGYKTVDYAKATASSRHARAMGGLVPESMGGAVYEPGNFSRGGFAYGGDPEDLKAILAQQSKSFGPFASGGLYGASAQQNPHGNAAGYVPKATLHTPKLLTSNFQPRQQQGEFQSALQNINAAGKAAETLSGGYDWAKKGYEKLTEKPKDPNATPDSNVAGPSDKTVSDTGRTVTIKPPASSSQMNPSAPKTTGFGTDEYIDPNLDPTAFSVPVAHGGGIIPRHHYAGGGFLDPYKEPTSGSMIPEDVMQDSEETKGEAEKLALKPAGGSGGGGGGGGGLMGAASTIGSLYGAAKGIGAMGTFLSSLPFFSDERLKDNIKQIGKTFDGQNIYSYDMGDGRTQMGLLAQEVLDHKPEAVGEKQGYLTVDYRKATEDSAPHRAAGGIVPRHGYQTAGGVPATDPLAGYDPKDLAIRTIAAETGGNPEETAGIAAVVRNRLASGNYGPDYRSVVTAKNQFEPWNNPQGANYPLRIDPESDRYKQAAAALTRHETEGYDPTDGATHFWAPKAQTALGRKAPSWDNENAKDIGATRFVKVDASGAPRQQSMQPQAQPQQQQTQGGLEQGKSVMDRLVPSDYKGRDVNAQGEQRGWGDFLTSRDFVLPLMAGLGTMASSPSRYLGAAILQGLGGAASAYQGVQKGQMDRDTAIASQIAGLKDLGPLVTQVGQGTVQAAPLTDVLSPGLKKQFAPGSEVGGVATPGGGTSATYRVAPITIDPSNDRYMYNVAPTGDTLKNTARLLGVNDLNPIAVRTALQLGNKTAADKAEAERVDTKIAQSDPQQIAETRAILGKSLSALTSLSPDPKNPFYAQTNAAAQIYNWAASKAGLEPVNEKEITAQALVDKFAALNPQTFGPGGGSHAGFIVENIRQAIPSAKTPDEAIRKVFSSVLSANQNRADFNRYVPEYRSAMGGASYNLMNSFEQDTGQQMLIESKAMEDAMKPRYPKDQNGRPILDANGQPVRQDSPLEVLYKNQGDPRVAKEFDKMYGRPGLARHFLGG